jgi:hypothetical protein
MASIPKVNGSFVNTDGSHGYSYTFTSTTVPHTHPPCLNYLSGGKNKKRYYNMKSKRNRYNKSKKNKTRKSRSRRNKKKMRGGYSQYQNNQPYSMNYSIGNNDQPIRTALANPAPYFIGSHSKSLENLDNYNHFTNKGFASKGWF